MLKFTDLNVCRRKFLGGMAFPAGTFVLGRLLRGSVAAASTTEKTDQERAPKTIHPMIASVRAFRIPFGTEPAIVFRPRRSTTPTERTSR